MFDPMSEIYQRVEKDSDSGCWVWKKSCNSAGYGQFTKNKKYWLAHRYSYAHTYGNLSDNDIVRHMCHNPKCSNPEHLAKGKHLDNWKDSEDVHKAAAKKLRKQWIIGSNTYSTFREAVEGSGISANSVNKYTDKSTRIFNIKKYREACIVAGWKPKI